MRRWFAIAAVVFTGASGCSLLVDWPSFSEGALDSGGDADAIADAEGGDADATPDEDAALDAGEVIFEDSFDEGGPLPRAWTTTDPVMILENATLARSAPRLVRATSPADASAYGTLSRTFALAGKSSVTCTFSLRLTEFGGAATLVAARLRANNSNSYVWLNIEDTYWQIYGQHPDEPSVSARHVRSMLDQWVTVSLTVAADGTIRGVVDGVERKGAFSGNNLESVRFQIGIVNPILNASLFELVYDDVVCTAK
jgi:hypothetical protein